MKRIYHVTLNIFFDQPSRPVQDDLDAVNALELRPTHIYTDHRGVHLRLDMPLGSTMADARDRVDQVRDQCRKSGLYCIKTGGSVTNRPPKRLPLKMRKKFGLPLNTPAW